MDGDENRHASASGMVIQTPDTPRSFGRIRMKTTTRMRDRSEEISAERKPLPRAVK
mgnify:CR=1 FL=1